MNYTIFYSWQSDLPSKFNRSFIQDALKKASKALSKDEDFSLDTVVDRDTFGMAGSPSIVESITGKIAKSDVFICDISIININSSERHTPNPNVLYELGFASAILGWERIIMIQNTAFGSIDNLPFDLRGRRVLAYHLDDKIEDKPGEKNKLGKQLVDILKKALEHCHKGDNIKEKILWWGDWNIDSKYKVREGNLHISRVSSDAFFFRIAIIDGSRTGEVSGKAKILTPHSAYARIKTHENENCEITFRRRLEMGAWLIEIEAGEQCNMFHGFNATFDGQYLHQPEMVINLGYLDEVDLNEIERMTGKYLSVFLNNFQLFGFEEETTEEEFTVVTAGVKGLYTIMESIVAMDRLGSIWCAFLDPNENVVRYFSNNNASHVPKVFNDWIARFQEKQIIENDENGQYSGDYE